MHVDVEVSYAKSEMLVFRAYSGVDEIPSKEHYYDNRRFNLT